jgi:CheY-like chemotaxis protein
MTQPQCEPEHRRNPEWADNPDVANEQTRMSPRTSPPGDDKDALVGEFLATLARELRSPLAPMRSSLEMMKLSQPSGAAVQIMQRQLGNLEHLVDDLTQMACITRGGVELQRESARLDAVLQSALDNAFVLTRAAKLRVSVSTPHEPIVVEGDPARLAQMFGHLISNAVKYSDGGSTITVEARREGQEAVVTVSDTGIGIEPELMPRLFGLFARGEQDAKPGYTGLGMGLAMVRRLAEMHGGSVKAESDGTGKGSRFSVRLPAKSVELPLNILVVDDNRDAAESMGMLLGHLGADVRVAEDGTQALAAFEVHRPQVVFLDIGMPGMDGYELAGRMRAMPPEPPVTLVALTGWDQDDDRKRVLSSGFDHHLVKPAQMAALQSLLESIQVRAA